jgi:hypothetical protein
VNARNNDGFTAIDRAAAGPPGKRERERQRDSARASERARARARERDSEREREREAELKHVSGLTTLED